MNQLRNALRNSSIGRIHRPMKRLFCRNGHFKCRATLQHVRFRSSKPVFSIAPRPQSPSAPDFCIVPGTVLFRGPERSGFQVSPKQSSCSNLNIVFGVLVVAGLFLGLSDTKELDLQGTSPIPYTPLSASPDSIRILVLLPGSGSQPIRCELASAQLSRSSSYEALSYCWGNQDDKKAIFVNDVKVEITANLWLALSSLRDAQNTRSLWADAICINQQDDNEVPLQISNMPSIYQRASSVIICLGNHSIHQHSSSIEPMSLDRLQSTITVELDSHTRTEQPLERSRDSYRAPDREAQHSLRQSTQEIINKAIREAKVAQVRIDHFLRNLVHDEYWKRGWIIQEVVVASENLVVQYGCHSVAWNDFMQWIRSYQIRHPDDGTVKQIERLDARRQSRSLAGSVFILANLLDDYKDAFTSRSRNGVAHDKIYAFLGLADDCPSGSFPVDKTKSAAQVYEDCIAYFSESSSITSQQRSIELVYFSSLIRRLLTRESALRPKPQRPFGEHPDEANMLLTLEDEQKRPDESVQNLPFQSAVLHGILTGAVKGLLMGIWMAIVSRGTTGQEWYWKASEAEDLALWVRNQGKPEKFDDLCIRGIIVEEIKYVGPTYTAVISAGKEVNRGSSVTANSPLNDTDLVARIQSLRNVETIFSSGESSTGHHIAHLPRPSQALSPSQSSITAKTAADTYEENSPRTFYGASGFAGLVPPQAQVGDLICRFWKSNTLAVVRREQQQSSVSLLLRNFFGGAGSRNNSRLIGRAIIANAELLKEDDTLRVQSELSDAKSETSIDVPVSLAALTHLSLNTIFWKGT